MRFLLALSLFFLSFTSLVAQEFSGGFRAGLNFVSFDGDAETGSDGTVYESFNNTTGFHVGATFALSFTDLFGVKGEFMYSQKGGQRDFAENTPSYFYLYSNADDTEGVPFGGSLQAEIDVVNSYIDLPLTVYYKLGPIELEAGASMGVLVSSRASGGYSFTNTIFGADPVAINIEGSYFSDGFAGEGVISRDPNGRGAQLVNLPNAVTPLYQYDNDEAPFRRLDFALVGGVSYFLNSGLFIGARYQYGLTDITKPENDLRISRENLNGPREYNEDDKDYTRNIQVSVGFRF